MKTHLYNIVLRQMLMAAVFALCSLSVLGITVSNTNNSGPGSLRQAIIDAKLNLNGGSPTEVIEFGVPGGGLVQLTSALPSLTTTNGNLIIRLRPGAQLPQGIEQAGSNLEGFWLLNSPATSTTLIEGITIKGFGQHGVRAWESENLTVKQCDFQFNNEGVSLREASNIVIDENNFDMTAFQTGINMQDPPSSATGPFALVVTVNGNTFTGGDHCIGIGMGKMAGGTIKVTNNNLSRGLITSGLSSTGIAVSNTNIMADQLTNSVIIGGNNVQDYSSMFTLFRPVPNWTIINNHVTKNLADGMAGWRIVNYQTTDNNPQGFSMVESNTLGIATNNTGNTFTVNNNSGLFHTFWMKGMYGAGFNIVGMTLPGGILVREGNSTTIRQNTIVSNNVTDDPIHLEAMGNEEITPPIVTASSYGSGNLSVSYTIGGNILPSWGHFVVDFYYANNNGDLLGHIGQQTHNTTGNYFANFTGLTPSVPRFAATVTSIGNLGDEIGTSAAIYFPIPCNTPPQADFTWDPACLNFPMQFNNTSTGTNGSTSYLWDFGNPASGANNTSALANPTHAFIAGAPQSFQVTLTVTKPGCPPSTVQHNVSVLADPVADFTWTPACLQDLTSFTNTSSGTGATTNYSWDFGDPNSGTFNSSPLPNPTHGFIGNGTPTQQTFNVTLDVNVPNCPTASVTHPVQIDPQPVADFTYTINCIGDVSSFTSTSVGTVPGTTYSWDFGDPNSNANNTSTAQNPNHVFVGQAGNFGNQTFVVTLTVNNPHCGPSTQAYQVTVCPPTCCEEDFPVPGINATQFQNIGQFYFDEATAQFVFKRTGCPGIFPVTCIGGNVNPTPLDFVVSSSAQTFSDNWKESANEHFDQDKLYPSTNNALAANDFERGWQNKWRPEASYVYRDALDQLAGQDKNFSKGTFPMVMFNWKNEQLNNSTEWVLTNQTNRYSPNGDPLEDQDVLGIKQTAKYGYNNTLPVLVAENASDHSVLYTSWEYVFPGTNTMDDGVHVDFANGSRQNDRAHTGEYSCRLATQSGSDAYRMGEIRITNQIKQEGMMLRTWVWVDPTKPEITNEMNARYHRPTQSVWWPVYIPMKKISGAGEWVLYEGMMPSGVFSSWNVGEIMELGLQVDMTNYAVGDIWVDDFRAQPLQSEMICYVYDNAQRLVATLDDQHYATLFQYNYEGLLVRKLKETIEGVKTLSEQHGNLPGRDR